MKAKKKQDGYYYEKIVKWQGNEEHSVASYFALALLCLLLGLMLGFALAQAEAKIWDLILFLVFATTVAFVSSFFETHDREVKYRKIGK